jgi:hypothetical protein
LEKLQFENESIVGDSDGRKYLSPNYSGQMLMAYLFNGAYKIAQGKSISP